jgi:hypothetical protein
MTPDDIDALIAGLRQDGGDDRDLSERFARAVGWTYHPDERDIGHSARSYWTDPKGMRFPVHCFVHDLTAIADTLPPRTAWGIAMIYDDINEAEAWIDRATRFHAAPTPEAALMIARLVLLRETGL